MNNKFYPLFYQIPLVGLSNIKLYSSSMEDYSTPSPSSKDYSKPSSPSRERTKVRVYNGAFLKSEGCSIPPFAKGEYKGDFNHLTPVTDRIFKHSEKCTDLVN